MAIINQEAGKKLSAAVGKERLTAFQLNFSVGELVSITITYNPDAEELAKLAPVFKEYEEIGKPG